MTMKTGLDAKHLCNHIEASSTFVNSSPWHAFGFCLFVIVLSTLFNLSSRALAAQPVLPSLFFSNVFETNISYCKILETMFACSLYGAG